MAGGRRIPFVGGDVLFHRMFLEKHLAARIEHQHMHRAMPQPARMNLTPRVLPDHLVALVDDVKNFFAHKKLRQERHICRNNNQKIFSPVGATYSENHSSSVLKIYLLS